MQNLGVTEMNYCVEKNYVPGISGNNIANLYDNLKIEMKHEPVENCWDVVCMNNELDGEERNCISRYIEIKREVQVKTEPGETMLANGVLLKSGWCDFNKVNANKDFKVKIRQGSMGGNRNMVNLENKMDEEKILNINSGIKIKQDNYLITEPRDSKFTQVGLLKLGLKDFNRANLNKDVKYEIKHEPVEVEWTDVYMGKEFDKEESKYNNSDLEIIQTYQVNTEPGYNNIDCEKLHQCIYCNKSFTSNDELLCHTKDHSEEKLYNCSQCEKVFSNITCLSKLLKTQTGYKSYQCNDCNMSFFEKSNLRKHTNTHTREKSYQCHYCDKMFTGNDELVCHIVHHTRGERLYKCSQCEMIVPSNSKLSQHFKSHTGEKPYQCSDCNQAFTLKCNLKQHKRTHTGDKPQQCSHCNKACLGKNQILKHMMTHTEEKVNIRSSESYFANGVLNKACIEDFIIENIDKNVEIEIKHEPVVGELNIDSTRKKENPKYIYRNIEIKQENQCNTESNESSFVPCDLLNPSINDLEFTNVNEVVEIKIKQEQVEGNDWKEACHFDKTFTEDDQVLGNLGTQTSETTYQCNLCDRSFSEDDKLRIHLRTHTEEKPFKCSHCDRTFSMNQYLRCHLKSHAREKSYQCHKCDISFIDNGNFIKHLRTHSGKNTYQCSQCNKPLSEGSHITGEKGVLCSHCAKAYSKNNDLRCPQKSLSYKRSRSPRTKYEENQIVKQDEDCQVIYIGCIAEGTTSEIRDRFRKFGTIKDISITFKGQRNSYGFIKFKDHIEAYQAIEYGNNDASLPQYYLCSKKKYEEDKLFNQGEDYRVLYIGCIAEGTTKAEFKDRFSIFGTIIDISIIFRGQRNHYSYIRFRRNGEAFKAMKHGNDDTSLPHYYLCLISRRKYEEDEFVEKQEEDRQVIYIGCIDDGTTKADIRDRFGKFGTIMDISMIFSGQRNNFGFITYSNPNETYKAIKHGNDDNSLPQYYLCSKRRYEEDNLVKQADGPPDIYIGCISEGTTIAELRDRFSKFGTIRNLSITFRDQRNNYVCIKFTNHDEAYKAIENGNNDTSLPQYYLCLRGSRKCEEDDFVKKHGKDRKVIYISYIAEDTTNIELRARFRKFGTITYISLVSKDQGNNFSFIAFKTHDEAYKAIKHGNDDTSLPHYYIVLGGRRIFCNRSYSDLDAQNPVDSDLGGHRSGRPSKSNEASLDFDELLRAAKQKKRRQ